LTSVYSIKILDTSANPIPVENLSTPIVLEFEIEISKLTNQPALKFWDGVDWNSTGCNTTVYPTNRTGYYLVRGEVTHLTEFSIVDSGAPLVVIYPPVPPSPTPNPVPNPTLLQILTMVEIKTELILPDQERLS
jgi:hypothetical protein